MMRNADKFRRTLEFVTFKMNTNDVLNLIGITDIRNVETPTLNMMLGAIICGKFYLTHQLLSLVYENTKGEIIELDMTKHAAIPISPEDFDNLLDDIDV